MIRKIVVPVDGSEASEKILPHLSEVFRAADADFRFVNVTGWNEEALKRGRLYLDDLKARASVRFPYVTTELLRGRSTAFEILKDAVVQHADLIAMMTHARTGLSRLLFGSTSRELVRISQIPVLLCRPSWSVRPIRKVLVPIDGSRTSQAVLPVAGDLALGAGARLVLLSVVPNAELRDVAGRQLRRVAATLSRRGVEVEQILKPGEAVEEILQTAREEGVDLIALGTHGRAGTERFFWGSVAESVLSEAETPLLIRRRPRILARLGRKTLQGAT